MDEIVRQAMAKWPNVPAVYGWLALDRRGNWLLKRETIGNQALNAFISRNYLRQDDGNDAGNEARAWYFQNGPQRVFVDLDYTPFVYRVTSGLNAPLALATHTGETVHTLRGAWIDEQGTVLLDSDRGIGIVHDQDLDPLLMASMIDINGNVIGETVYDELVDLIEHQKPIPLWLKFRDSNVRFEPIRAGDVPARFAFNPHPIEQPAVTP